MPKELRVSEVTLSDNILHFGRIKYEGLGDKVQKYTEGICPISTCPCDYFLHNVCRQTIEPYIRMGRTMAVYILVRRPSFLYKNPFTFRQFNCYSGSHVDYISGKFQSLPIRGKCSSGTLASVVKTINSVLVAFRPHTTIINITKLSAYPITFTSLLSNIHKISPTRPGRP